MFNSLSKKFDGLENWQKFLLLNAYLIFGIIFLYPVFFWLHIVRPLLKKLNLKRFVHSFITYIFIALMLVVNGFHFASFFQSAPSVINFSLFYPLFWVAEAMHFTVFAWMFFGLYRSVRYENAPHSSLFSALFNFVHVTYYGCPITQTQNYFLAGSGMETLHNVFWRGFLDPYTDIFRVIFFVLCLYLFYHAYQTYRRLQIPFDEWLAFWNENKIIQQNAKTIPAKHKVAV